MVQDFSRDDWHLDYLGITIRLVLSKRKTFSFACPRGWANDSYLKTKNRDELPQFLSQLLYLFSKCRDISL